MTSAQLLIDVNAELTPRPRKRQRVERETTSYLEFVRRVVRRAGRRVSGEDADELKALVAIREDLDAAIVEAVSGLRRSGYTWTDIGAIQGVSKQAAEQWYARRVDPAPGK